ncbi:MAG: alpha/beta hydrolase [Verrucomicrobiota bacterium]
MRSTFFLGILASLLIFAANEGVAENKGTNDLQSLKKARIRFAQERRPLPRHGLYQDFRARFSTNSIWFPRWTKSGDPIPDSGLRFSGVTNAQEILAEHGVAFATNSSNATAWVTHVLAEGLTEPLAREGLSNRHFYVADDALCDPTGFMFGAMNNLGVFTMGDTVPSLGKSKVIAATPLPAKLRLFREATLVQETTGTNLTFETKDPGAYRLEAALLVDGIEHPWIYSSPVRLRTPDLLELASLMPSMEISPGVERHADISYRDGPENEAAKHKLDVYRPKEKTNSPVLFFIHGGAWKTGDRSQYPPFGNRFAREGFVVVIPSYRLAPRHPHPAQIEDAAAAFAWTAQHVAEFGGDTNRIFVAGHSAGGHLAALLSLDEHHLALYQLSPKNIRGVLALSGVYDLTEGESFDSAFGQDAASRKNASPLSHVSKQAPPFLVTYCQWDYFSLPAQAKDFSAALRKAGTPVELVFIPAQSHISEMLNITKENDPTVAAALKFMNNR